MNFFLFKIIFSPANENVPLSVPFNEPTKNQPEIFAPSPVNVFNPQSATPTGQFSSEPAKNFTSLSSQPFPSTVFNQPEADKTPVSLFTPTPIPSVSSYQADSGPQSLAPPPVNVFNPQPATPTSQFSSEPEQNLASSSSLHFTAAFNQPEADKTPVSIFSPALNPSVSSNQADSVAKLPQTFAPPPLSVFNPQPTNPTSQFSCEPAQNFTQTPVSFFNPDQFSSAPFIKAEKDQESKTNPVSIFNPSPILSVTSDQVESISKVSETVAPTPVNIFNPQLESLNQPEQENKNVTPVRIFSPPPVIPVSPNPISSAEKLPEIQSSQPINVFNIQSQPTFEIQAQPEKIPPPVSIFNPLSAQVQTEPDSTPVGLAPVTDLQQQPIQSLPDTQESLVQNKDSSIATGVSFFNPFSVDQPIEAPSPIVNIQAKAQPYLHSFFGGHSQSVPAESIGETAFPEAYPSVVASSALTSTEPAKPFTNNNFFDSAPFNPFHQQINPNIVAQPQSEDTINTGIQNLSLDKENNFLTPKEDNKDQSSIDPISFFNNNIPTSQNQFSSNSISTPANEFTIQNFFNNPPLLSDVQEDVQDSNYNLIRTDILNKRIERVARAEHNLFGNESPETLSIASVIAEPPSSAQSEISEYAEPPVADVIPQSVPESIQSNQVSFTRKSSATSTSIKLISFFVFSFIFLFLFLYQDQADGINIFNWLDKQKSEEITSNMASNERTTTPTSTTATNIVYRPVYKHWFYKTTSESKRIWIPFSFTDSMLLEEAFTMQGQF